jgi:hypothetical protein
MTRTVPALAFGRASATLRQKLAFILCTYEFGSSFNNVSNVDFILVCIHVLCHNYLLQN